MCRVITVWRITSTILTPNNCPLPMMLGVLQPQRKPPHATKASRSHTVHVRRAKKTLKQTRKQKAKETLPLEKGTLFRWNTQSRHPKTKPKTWRKNVTLRDQTPHVGMWVTDATSPCFDLGISGAFFPSVIFSDVFVFDFFGVPSKERQTWFPGRWDLPRLRRMAFGQSSPSLTIL